MRGVRESVLADSDPMHAPIGNPAKLSRINIAN
jgi:hypothetical protein